MHTLPVSHFLHFEQLENDQLGKFFDSCAADGAECLSLTPPELERLAAELFVSKYHIAHVFKDEIGMSIHQYISKKRLARCREALLGDVPVTKVYLLFGFHDYSSFYRAFKKEYGISPKDFKKLHTVTSD